MFKGARNLKFKDSSFTVNVGTTQLTENHLGPLFDSVSLNAILNAGGRADEVRCYPGTREEIIEKVERWTEGKSQPDRRFLWLSGHAGAGKSAIAQSVAERGANHGIHAANFFFFRSDTTRNHERPLVATLVYQLMDFYPALREHLADLVTAKPLTHKASVAEQFARILAYPIEKIYNTSSLSQEIILIIDGLDECNDEEAQLQILGALHTLVSRDGSPFRVFVASRAEPHLVMFFNKIAESVESLFLNDEYQPEDDIRKFVIAKFDEIKRTHHLAHSLCTDWPTGTDVEKIVSKSSGQFIYAATVMRFIEHSKDSPALSLLTVHEIRPPTTHSPFAQLDALYSHVFSKARDIRAIMWAIGFDLMDLSFTGREMLYMVGYEAIDLQSLFADISSIAKFSINRSQQLDVRFYHASLPDYLKNKSRSGIYHLNQGRVCADASAICLAKFYDTKSLDYIIHTMSQIKQPTAELSKSLFDASRRKFDHSFPRPVDWHTLIFKIADLHFRTDKTLCNRILRGWIRFAFIHRFDATIVDGWLHPAARRYYERLRMTEKVKFIVWRIFNR